MTSEDFIRELKEAMLKIELSNKRILFMHPEDIAVVYILLKKEDWNIVKR